MVTIPPLAGRLSEVLALTFSPTNKSKLFVAVIFSKAEDSQETTRYVAVP